MAEVPLGGVLKVLIAAEVVADIHDERLSSTVVLTDIQTLTGAEILDGSKEGGVQVGDKHLWVDIVQVPGKVVTV